MMVTLGKLEEFKPEAVPGVPGVVIFSLAENDIAREKQVSVLIFDHDWGDYLRVVAETPHPRCPDIKEPR